MPRIRIRWNVLEVAHALDTLVEHTLEILRVGSDLHVGVAQFVRHDIEGRSGKAVPECRISTIVAKEAGSHHELMDDLGVSERHLQGDRADVAETEEIRLADCAGIRAELPYRRPIAQS
jgi:hypothetical protein